MTLMLDLVFSGVRNRNFKKLVESLRITQNLFVQVFRSSWENDIDDDFDDDDDSDVRFWCQNFFHQTS